MAKRAPSSTPEKSAALKSARTYLTMQEQQREEAVEELAMELGISDDRAHDLFESAVATLL